jgi:hypothetical protein
MKRRPWILVLLAILHFLAPLGNIILNAVITHEDILAYIVRATSPEYLMANWFIIIIPIIAGYSIYACQRWSFYAYILSMALLFYFSYSGYMSKVEHLSLFPVILVYLVNISIVTYFLVPAVRNIYFDRRMRWWEIQSRYEASFNCLWFNIKSKRWIEGKVTNISENGLFMNSNEIPGDKLQIEIMLTVKNDEIFDFHGETIIHDQKGFLGFGVKFDHTKDSRKQIKEIIDQLDRNGKKIEHLNIRPEDSFSYWVRTLVTTGQGFFPAKSKKSKN